MNQDEIIAMAKEAGMDEMGGVRDNGDSATYFEGWPEQLAAFAVLVAEKAAAKERDSVLSNVRPVVVEALRSATGCPDLKGLDGKYLVSPIEDLMAAAIRARGQKGGV